MLLIAVPAAVGSQKDLCWPSSAAPESPAFRSHTVKQPVQRKPASEEWDVLWGANNPTHSRPTRD